MSGSPVTGTTEESEVRPREYPSEDAAEPPNQLPVFHALTQTAGLACEGGQTWPHSEPEGSLRGLALSDESSSTEGAMLGGFKNRGMSVSQERGGAYTPSPTW